MKGLICTEMHCTAERAIDNIETIIEGIKVCSLSFDEKKAIIEIAEKAITNVHRISDQHQKALDLVEDDMWITENKDIESLRTWSSIVVYEGQCAKLPES